MGAWRNMEGGNDFAGARVPRLTRAKAEELLTDISDRADAYNLKSDTPVSIRKIMVFGGINGKHEKIQDIDLGVQMAPKDEESIRESERESAFKELRGRSPTLKLHSIEFFNGVPGRVVLEA
jgi:hypothetical protein